jgi:hypothetical protein
MDSIKDHAFNSSYIDAMGFKEQKHLSKKKFPQN